ncbi:MAG TPA: protein kinase [Gemmatimonadales bacterium]|nr:protein kinase [Gemmatimonadales bacterium]
MGRHIGAMTLEQLSAALADRHRIERKLGEGGMAMVYLAEDLRHHRKVAVKVLRPELAAALGPERFLREIATTANLRHPHILPLYDSGEAAGFLYYVMPLVEGESLRDRLDRQKQLPIDEALSIAREVADAGVRRGMSVGHRNLLLLPARSQRTKASRTSAGHRLGQASARKQSLPRWPAYVGSCGRSGAPLTCPKLSCCRRCHSATGWARS